jgi:NAD(P)-dependent dehydrogenase (short-subunit alcohol dehydrogenase family)
MTDRAALVTGGSSGMGKAMAMVLGQEGYALTICGRDRGKLDGAVEELRGEGFEAQGVAGDVTQEAAVVEVVGAHLGAYGRLDVVANTAGGTGGAGGGPLATMAVETVDRAMAANIRSVFLLIHHSLEALLAAGAEHGKALFVNIGSAAGKEGTPGLSQYSAAKAGVRMLTEAAQAENRNRGVQFSTLIPGFVDTPPATWAVAMGVGHEEMLAPEDLGEAVRFLLRTSPRCIVREIELMPPDQPGFLARLNAARRERAAAGSGPS